MSELRKKIAQAARGCGSQKEYEKLLDCFDAWEERLAQAELA